MQQGGYRVEAAKAITNMEQEDVLCRVPLKDNKSGNAAKTGSNGKC